MLLFIAGIFFFELLLPFISTIFEILTIRLEVFKAKYSLDITKINSKIKQIAENEGYPENKRAIGFTSEPAEVEEALEEDDVYEDD